MKRRALVLGIHSFIDSYLKVGIQYIAEGLADIGWSVDYVSIFSSPLDLYGAQRRKRFTRIWKRRQDIHGTLIRSDFKEYAFRAPFPANNRILRYRWQLPFYTLFAQPWLKKRRYDVCIHDVTSNILYLPLVRANATILRLNDHPDGFKKTLSKHIINRFEKNLRFKLYDEIWCAHKPLTDYAMALNPRNKAVTIYNGIDDNFTSHSQEVKKLPKSAVFIGSLEHWVDLDLLDKAALLLKDWRFDIFGPANRNWTCKANNIFLMPPISRAKVPETLSRYQVGLIPFRDIPGLIDHIEKPLKFFEYIGAGLGVASTDFGALRQGMGHLASFGNDPESFARAIVREAERSEKRPWSTCQDFVHQNSWSQIMHIIGRRIENIK